mgnify:FL=1|jgi:hypothetical protein
MDLQVKHKDDKESALEKNGKDEFQYFRNRKRKDTINHETTN